MEIKTYPVNSSNLARAGYDTKTQTLEVTFHNGKTYHYHNVPKYAYDGIFKAESAGSFFHNIIKRGGYKNEELK